MIMSKNNVYKASVLLVKFFICQDILFTQLLRLLAMQKFLGLCVKKSKKGFPPQSILVSQTMDPLTTNTKFHLQSKLWDGSIVNTFSSPENLSFLKNQSDLQIRTIRVSSRPVSIYHNKTGV